MTSTMHGAPPDDAETDGARPMRVPFPRVGLLFPTPELIRTRAPILAPTLMTAFVVAVTVAGTVPLVRAAYAARPEMLLAAVTSLWAMAALSPLAALLKGVALGGVAWSVMVLTGVQVRYRTMASAVIYGQVILGLQGAWITALLWMRGLGAVRQPADLILPTGLDVLFSDPSSALGAVARGVTPFYCAWFVFLTVIFARAAHRGWWRAALAAFGAWTLGTGLGVVRALMV
ncbi:MAG: hypothetical protein LJF06_10975 [Gemmatimonadetes bacterium]|nr:hypothetical protein [Gemmatimonadota bacterium]